MQQTDDWESATWEGLIRQQIRRSLALTVLQRLEELEKLCETSEFLSQAVKKQAKKSETKGLDF